MLQFRHLAIVIQAKDSFSPYVRKPKVLSLIFSGREIGLGLFVWHRHSALCRLQLSCYTCAATGSWL